MDSYFGQCGQIYNIEVFIIIEYMNSSKTLAPIVFFTFSRLEQTIQTVQALLQNPLAQYSDIYIYSDAGRNEQEIAKVQQVRDYLDSITGFKSISIMKQEKNKGLSNSIIDGITEVVNKYGTVIVIEDDIVVAPNFLDYVNDALKFYKDKKKLWHIAGYQFPINYSLFPNQTTVFSRYMSCWGWATWKDRWQYMERNPEQLVQTFSDEEIHEFNCRVQGAQPFWCQVLGNYEGVMDTWDIFWFSTIFQHKGLCLLPVKTFVKNIGHDVDGEHSRKNQKHNFHSNHLQNTHWEFSENIVENMTCLQEIKNFYDAIYNPKLNIFQKVILYVGYFRKKSFKEKCITIFRRLGLYRQ